MEDTGQLFDIENKATESKLTLAVFDKIFLFETGRGYLEAIQVGAVVLLEGSDDCLHALTSAGGVFAEVREADLDLVAKFGRLLLCFGDTRSVAVG